MQQGNTRTGPDSRDTRLPLAATPCLLHYTNKKITPPCIAMKAGKVGHRLVHPIHHARSIVATHVKGVIAEWLLQAQQETQ